MLNQPKILKGIAYLCFIPYFDDIKENHSTNQNITEDNNNNCTNKETTKNDTDTNLNNNEEENEKENENENINENENENENNNDNNNINMDQQENNYSNNNYHWFQGIFISLPDKTSYGLMGDTSESPPLPHPCCYPDKTCPPKFYNLTVIDYTTNKKTFIKYILQTGGDNISLSSDWEPDNFVMNDKIRKFLSNTRPHFEFNTLTVKYNDDAVNFMKNYFPKLKPEPSCIICIGNLEIELN